MLFHHIPFFARYQLGLFKMPDNLGREPKCSCTAALESFGTIFSEFRLRLANTTGSVQGSHLVSPVFESPSGLVSEVVYQTLPPWVTPWWGGWGYPADVRANTMCSVSTKTNIPLPLPFYQKIFIY